MKIIALVPAILILASVMISPSLSYAQSNTTSTNSNNNTISLNDTMAATMQNNTMSSQNGTQPTMSSEDNSTKEVQKVSDFVTQATSDFKQQGADTRQLMIDCQSKVMSAHSSDVEKIKSDCQVQLNTIKQKYQSERMQLHDYIMKYRSSIMTLMQQAKGMPVDKDAVGKALDAIKMKMGDMSGRAMPGMGMMATTNNTHCVNPPGGPAIC